MATKAVSIEKEPNRWLQLGLGIICMAFIANLQYSWYLFAPKILAQNPDWGREAVQWTFTFFIAVETWLVPVEGWLVDKFGPKPVIMGGAILGAAGWLINSTADTVWMLRLGQIVAGMGAGAVYGTCVGNAVKWFPDKRGLAAGCTAAGFGAGAAVTVLPIGMAIEHWGYAQAFAFFGILQGLIIFFVAMMLNNNPRAPKNVVIQAKVVSAKYGKTMGEMLKTPVFWLMYLCFVGVGAGGLMATAQLGLMAQDLGADKYVVELMFLAMPLLAMAGAADNLCNGLTRPFFGWVSDRIGRENTMLIVFTGEGLALLGMMMFGHNPYGFMICAALIFGFWGEIFSLFPAMNGDTYGNKYAAGNAGALYTAKGAAAFAVPLSTWLSQGGNWDRVMLSFAAIAFAASALAFFVLKPLRAAYIAKNNALWDEEQARLGLVAPKEAQARMGAVKVA